MIYKNNRRHFEDQTAQLVAINNLICNEISM